MNRKIITEYLKTLVFAVVATLVAGTALCFLLFASGRSLDTSMPQYLILNVNQYLSQSETGFSLEKEGMEQLDVDYVEAASCGEATATDEQYRSGVGLLRLLQLFAQLPAAMAIYRQSILPFAEALHESNRTADDYAAAFGASFFSSLAFSASDPSWAALSNVSVQYVSAVMPEKGQPQLFKRMHYYIFNVEY